jgi:hypothetical protein
VRLPAAREEFDRLAFAMRALQVLRPRATRVAVYPCRSELRVEQGRDLERGTSARWATVGIPPDASREHIAVALANLAGETETPFMIDSLIALGTAEV